MLKYNKNTLTRKISLMIASLPLGQKDKITASPRYADIYLIKM